MEWIMLKRNDLAIVWIVVCTVILLVYSAAWTVAYVTRDKPVSQKVDSSWRGGPSDYSVSLDYMNLHPVCRDALRDYVITDPKMVSYMCNMVGDIWVTDLLKEDKP